MRAGQPIRAELIYPVFVDNTLTLPAKTILTGTVTELRSDHSRRINARVNGDFTPYRIPIVHFTHIILADGTELPIATGTATDGAPLLRLTAPKPHKGGLIHKEWEYGMQMLHEQTVVFTAPGKADRFVQFIYHQLPYHPERIEKGTAWTIETIEPLSLPPQTAQAIADATPTTPPSDSPPATDSNGRQPWIIQAYLRDQLTSATAKSGQPITAIVAEPVYNADHTIAVPQGAAIIGAITNAKPAKSFARAGALGFDFKQIVLPGGQTQNVQTALTGAGCRCQRQSRHDLRGPGAAQAAGQDPRPPPPRLPRHPPPRRRPRRPSRRETPLEPTASASSEISSAWPAAPAKISTVRIGAYGTAVLHLSPLDRPKAARSPSPTTPA